MDYYNKFSIKSMFIRITETSYCTIFIGFARKPTCDPNTEVQSYRQKNVYTLGILRLSQHAVNKT